MEATSRTEGGEASGGGEEEEEEEEGPMLSDAELDRMLLDWEPEGGEGEGEDGQQEVLLEEFMSAAEGVAATEPGGGETGDVVRAKSTLLREEAEERRGGSVPGAEGRVLERLPAPKPAPSQAEQRVAYRQRSTAVPPAFSAEASSSRPGGAGAELEGGDEDDDLMGFENPLDDLLPASSGPQSSLPSNSAYDQPQGSGALWADLGQTSPFPQSAGGAASSSAAGSVLAQIQAALQAGASPEELKRLIDQAFAATQQQGGGSEGGSPSAVAPPAAASKPRAPPPPRAAGPSRPPPVPPSDDPLLQLRPEIRRQLEGEEAREGGRDGGEGGGL